MRVWQKGIDLAKAVHVVAEHMAANERSGLVEQMYRSAASIPASIAEGFGRRQRREFLRFASNAKGSLNELETYLTLVEQLGLAPTEKLAPAKGLADDVGRMLTALRHSLQRRIGGPGERRGGRGESDAVERDAGDDSM